MSKLTRLATRMGDLVGRRVELLFRVAEIARNTVQGALALDAVNEIATLSEQIGQLQMAMADEQGRIQADERHGNPADPGEPVDLRMASGVQTCVECHEIRGLDKNGRCGVCAMCVAGATA